MPVLAAHLHGVSSTLQSQLALAEKAISGRITPQRDMQQYSCVHADALDSRQLLMSSTRTSTSHA